MLKSDTDDPKIIFTNYDLPNTVFMNTIMLQRIFTRKETYWNNRENITVYIKPIDSIEHRFFIMSVLNMTIYNYKHNLEVNTYTARATNVVEVQNDAAMIQLVHSHNGAIGYVNYQLITYNKTIVICDDLPQCQ
jgi:ABC-type phosphate transport system substrate-binding protein